MNQRMDTTSELPLPLSHRVFFEVELVLLPSSNQRISISEEAQYSSSSLLPGRNQYGTTILQDTMEEEIIAETMASSPVVTSSPSLFSWLIQDAFDEILPLAKGPIHLPKEHAYQRVFPAIAVTMAITSIIYVASFPLAARLIPSSTSTTTTETAEARRRMCYQVTNMSTNLFLGLMGCYFEYVLKPTNPPMAEKVQGQEDYYIFSAVQIGYQLWSLLVGIFLVPERIEMMFHHTAVICVGAMSAFFNNGFRYWTPYFFGIFELSSVPLGVMNAFKDNQEWMTKYPNRYFQTRIVFAVTFLTIRIVMLIPRLIYLRDCFLVPYLMDPKHFGYRTFLFMVWASSCFLFGLQLFWGYLIVSGIVKTVMKPKKKAAASENGTAKKQQ